MTLDPALSQALATFIGTLATVVLWYGAYKWGPNRREAKEFKKKSETKEIEDESSE